MAKMAILVNALIVIYSPSSCCIHDDRWWAFSDNQFSHHFARILHFTKSSGSSVNLSCFHSFVQAFLETVNWHSTHSLLWQTIPHVDHVTGKEMLACRRYTVWISSSSPNNVHGLWCSCLLIAWWPAMIRPSRGDGCIYTPRAYHFDIFCRPVMKDPRFSDSDCSLIFESPFRSLYLFNQFHVMRSPYLGVVLEMQSTCWNKQLFRHLGNHIVEWSLD